MVSDNYRVKVSDIGFHKLKIENQTQTQVSSIAWTAPEITKDSTFSVCFIIN